MATDRADSFLDNLRDSRLLEPTQFSELTSTPDAQNTDPQLLAQCLVEMGWLTRYQVDHLREACNQDLKLGTYQLIDRLGVGGTGPAYKARRPGKKGTVTLKLIRKNRITAPPLVPRFMQDIRTAALLQHEHIAPVVTVGQLGGLYLFAREFVEGTDLERQVRENAPLSSARACDAARQAALALHYAHQQGLEHRRVKAANLIAVSAQTNGHGPSIKLVDFGLAQLTTSQALPAQKPAGPHADLRGLGRTLQFLLTGQTTAERPALTPEVRSILDRLLDNGFPTAAAAAEALEPCCREAVPELPVAVAVPVEPEPTPEPDELPVAVAMVAAEVTPIEPEPTPIAIVAEAPAEPEPEPAPMAVEETPEPEPEPVELPMAVAMVAAEEPPMEAEETPVAVAVVAAEEMPQEPEPVELPAAVAMTAIEPITITTAEAPPEPGSLPMAVAMIAAEPMPAEPEPMVIPSLSLEDDVPGAVAVAVAVPAEPEPIFAEILAAVPIEGVAVPIDAVTIVEPEQPIIEAIEPVAIAAVLPPPEEMPAPIEPLDDLPVASAVAFVGELPAEAAPTPAEVAVTSEAEPSLASAVAVVEAVSDDLPVASAVAFVSEPPVEESAPAIVAAVVTEEAPPPIEAIAAVSEPVAVLEPEAVELPVASAVAVVEAVIEAEVPVITAIEAIVEVPLASAVEVVAEMPVVEAPATDAPAAFNPVQELPAPDLVPEPPPPEPLGLVPEPPLWTPESGPLMHSGILTPDRLGPPLAEPVEEAPAPTPPVSEAAPLPPVEPAPPVPPIDAPPAENPLAFTAEAPPAADNPLAFTTGTGPAAENPLAFTTGAPPTGFPGEGITTQPQEGAPADPFLSDAPGEGTTFSSGTAAPGARRGRQKKMSWSLKNFTKLQLVGCLVGILCNLVLAPFLIYMIWTNLFPPSPPPPTRKVVKPAPAVPATRPQKPTDPDRLEDGDKLNPPGNP